MIKALCKELDNKLYGTGAVSFAIECGKFNYMSIRRVHDYTIYEDSLEITFDDDSAISIPLNEIVSIESADEVDCIDYKVSSNNGWIAYFGFLNT